MLTDEATAPTPRSTAAPANRHRAAKALWWQHKQNTSHAHIHTPFAASVLHSLRTARVVCVSS